MYTQYTYIYTLYIVHCILICNNSKILYEEYFTVLTSCTNYCELKKIYNVHGIYTNPYKWLTIYFFNILQCWCIGVTIVMFLSPTFTHMHNTFSVAINKKI